MGLAGWYLTSEHSRNLQISEIRHPLAHAKKTAGEALHHFTRLRILLEERIYFLDRSAAALGDAPPPRPVDDHVIGALAGGHRARDR